LVTDQPDDAMVVVAALVSRVEALVVASMLDAAGIQVHVGGAAHASVQVNSVALGGHRLWVPVAQHHAASELLLEVLGEDEWAYCFGLRRVVLRVLAVWVGLVVASYGVGFVIGALAIFDLWIFPLSALSLPVNPHGRGDYYLCDAEGRVSAA
jgi:hypothetical protein